MSLQNAVWYMTFKKLAIAVAVALALTLGLATATQSKVSVLGVHCVEDTCTKALFINEEIEEGEILDFLKAANKLYNYHIVIHTPGGSASDTLAIMQRIADLKSRGCHITTETLVAAFSGGAFIFCMGDERIANRGDSFMFHTIQIYDPNTGKQLHISELPEEVQDLIRARNAQMRQLLLDTIGDADVVNKLLKEGDNWFTAEELYAMGVVTKLR